MFFDLMYFIGGNTLVEIADATIAPLYSWACNIATIYGGIFDIYATMLETVLS